MSTERGRVSDRGVGTSVGPSSAGPFWARAGRVLLESTATIRRILRDERGAVTAEYAIVIMAAVAFAGVLVAIIRSEQIREMLVTLVENALGTGAS